MRNDCVYPDWQGGFTAAEHIFDKDGWCIICGKYDPPTPVSQPEKQPRFQEKKEKFDNQKDLK